MCETLKPASIIFLIVAAAIAIGGFTTMMVAEGIASAEGIELVNRADENGEGNFFTYEYNSSNIGKIKMSVKAAEVNIIGNSDRAYIELINFPDGAYEFSDTNRMVNISNDTGIASLSGIASAVMNFKGFRSLINNINIGSLEKTVNIYISNQSPLNIVEISVEKGNVNIKDCRTATDYLVTVGEGNVSAEGVVTTSTVESVVSDGQIRLSNSSMTNLKLVIGSGNIDVSDSSVQVLEASLKEGDFIYKGDSYGAGLDLYTAAGNVRVNGISKGGQGYYKADSADGRKFSVNSVSGDIVFN